LKIENSPTKVKNWSCPIYRYGTFSDCKLVADSKNVQILLFEGQFQELEVKKVNIYEIFKFRHFLIILTWNIYSWPSNNKIFTFLESASNLQSEKVPYWYIGQLQFLTFIWEFSIFKTSGLPTNLKKIKIKYAEIDFTLHHSFLMLRKVEKINLNLHPY
jgi:hypothetical protein